MRKHYALKATKYIMSHNAKLAAYKNIYVMITLLKTITRENKLIS